MTTPAERIDALAADMEEEHGPGVVVWAMLFCNGCGTGTSIEAGQTDLRGWTLGPHGADKDYCPVCTEARVGT